MFGFSVCFALFPSLCAPVDGLCAVHSLCTYGIHSSFSILFSARAHTFLYTPYTTCYRVLYVRVREYLSERRDECATELRIRSMTFSNCSLHSLVFAEIVRSVARSPLLWLAADCYFCCCYYYSGC